MQQIPVGAGAVLVEVAGAAEAGALAAWARGRVPALEIVPAAKTVLFDGIRGPLDLTGFTPAAAPVGKLVEVPVVYDGPDLADVAEMWGMAVEEAVARHVECEYTVAFCGFAPGFSYLTGLPASLAVPRLDTPRSSVPAGSVAVAGEYTGIYPSASPGGWRLLARTDAVLWDVDRDPPALLSPGCRVRFVPR